MLDTSRHYFSVESIKRTLVAMSHSKLNRFHWHLTDSQSFPFVSKYYPELAKYGAYSSNEVYTRDDMRDIANFAQVRGIQILPEIDAPAHAGMLRETRCILHLIKGNFQAMAGSGAPRRALES
jgi:N-acetyl-beta-hexosaminidase